YVCYILLVCSSFRVLFLSMARVSFVVIRSRCRIALLAVLFTSPGEPLLLAPVEVRSKQERKILPIAILPGFPTSAIFTFHEFIAPVIRSLAGRPEAHAEIVPARLPLRVNSERGRTEYLLVNLVSEAPGKDPRTTSPAQH